MPYAPGIAQFLERQSSLLPEDFYCYPLVQQRQMYEAAVSAFPVEPPAAVTVEADAVESDGRRIPLSRYRPVAADGQACVLYIHGGGFILGGLATHHSICAELALKTGATVLAADFRLGPDDTFPCSTDDLAAVLDDLARTPERHGIDPSRLVLAGDGSGANLAAALCLLARDNGGPALRGQVLLDPLLDLYRWSQLILGPEHTDYEKAMQFLVNSYLGWTADPEDPYASPLLAESLVGLPPAYIATSENDRLRDDAERYAERLKEAGVPVELVVEPGLVPGAVFARGISEAAAQAFERTCRAARQMLGALADA